MEKVKLVLATLLVCLTLPSCVSLLGTKKKVYINSTPSNANVYRDDGVYVGQTPLIYKGKAHHNFIISKNGYYNYGLKTTRKFNPLYLGNIVWVYGFLEYNNAYKFKDTNYSVMLTPKPTQPAYTTTIAPARVPTLLESVSANTENYTSPSALSVIKPTYSNTANRTILKGSEIFKRYSNAVFMLYGSTSNGEQIWQGSGFFVSPNGLAVSNYHNFKDAEKISVKFYGSNSYQTISKNDILAYSKNEDYIIFKVQGKFNNPYVPIANTRGEIGDKVYTIGSPKGLENTFSSGEISQYRIEQGYIQINAPIDHGSSGGVLINEYGEAIGITSAGRDDSGANLNFCRDLLYIMNRYK